MRISRRHLRNRLEQLGNEPAPPADTHFARRLEERLLSTRRGSDFVTPTAAPPPVRAWRTMPIALGAAAAAAAVFVVLALLPEPAPDSVYFEPGSTTTSVEPTTTTTLVPDPPFPFTTTTTAPAPAPKPPTTGFFEPSPTTYPEKPTSTFAPRPTPSTTQKPTSTTQKPAGSSITLTCAAGHADGSAGISCGWSESTSRDFAGYKLWRKVADGQPAVVFQTQDRTMRRYLDRDVAMGTNYAYLVQAVDRSGNVIASSSAVKVTCC